MNNIDNQINELENSIKINEDICLESNEVINEFANNVKLCLYKLTELNFLNNKIYKVLLVLFPYDTPWKKELIMNYLMKLLNKYKYWMKDENIAEYYKKLENLKIISDIIDEIHYNFVDMKIINARYGNNLVDKLNKQRKLYKLKRKRR